jgi:RNA 3'-terminal phosphate cyclase (ATP)
VREGKMNQVAASLVKQVSDELIAELQHGGCVDAYLRDQLVVFQALAEGKSKVYGGAKKGIDVQPSLHTKTAHWVAKELIGVEFDADGNCEGIGFAIDHEERTVDDARPVLADKLENLTVSA